MERWWQRVVVPVKRALVAVAARVRPRKHGGELVKLRDEVQMCGYEDVQVMWEILQRSAAELAGAPTSKQRSGGRSCF